MQNRKEGKLTKNPFTFILLTLKINIGKGNAIFLCVQKISKRRRLSQSGGETAWKLHWGISLACVFVV